MLEYVTVNLTLVLDPVAASLPSLLILKASRGTVIVMPVSKTSTDKCVYYNALD
jgi:hypothetical protein